MSNDGKKQWIKRRGAQPVADLVSKLLDPVIERRAGMTMDLIGSWPEIVGVRHADHSRPERLHWPRKSGEDDPFEPATLMIACESGHALFLQHDSDAVITAVNEYFGFSAVARIKLLQKPVGSVDRDQKAGSNDMDGDARSRLSSLIDQVEDPGLKRALEKMGARRVQPTFIAKVTGWILEAHSHKKFPVTQKCRPGEEPVWNLPPKKHSLPAETHKI